MKHFTFFSLTLTALLVEQSIASAQIGAPLPGPIQNVFYVDPVNGSKTGDGSAANPWRTLQEVWTSKLINGVDRKTGVVHAGDVIYLLSGNHGSLEISPYKGSLKAVNTDYITFEAAPGHTPVINSLRFIKCAKWIVRGITFENPPVMTVKPSLVFAENSTDMIIDSNNIRSAADVADWTPEDWPTLCAEFGINFNIVRRATVSNNVIRGVHNGITLRGSSILLTGNTVDYFANDGIQFSASHTIISHNIVSNHYGLWNDGYHHDGMQGWTASGETFTTNVTIDSNMVLATTGAYSTIPVAPTGVGDDYMQGISIFNGVWDHVTVTNNVVFAAAYHGMAFYGIKDSVIANNTVIGKSPTYTSWLGIFKNATIPTNVIVRNNIAEKFSLLETGVAFDHNLTFVRSGPVWQRDAIPVIDPVATFVMYDPSLSLYDFRLKPGSAPIGAGSSLNAPEFDILSVPRDPLQIDIGAYAYTGEFASLPEEESPASGAGSSLNSLGVDTPSVPEDQLEFEFSANVYSGESE